MKILRIISYGFQAGGAETGVVELDNELKKHGFKIKIISSDAGPKKKHFSDIEFKAIDPNNPFKVFLHIFNISAYLTIRKTLKEYKPDVVHLHIMDEISPLVLLLFRKTPTIMTIHGPEFFISKTIIWLLNKENFKGEVISEKNFNRTGKINYFYFKYIQGTVYKLTLRNVDLFIFLSNYMKEFTDNKLNPNTVINNGVKLLKFKPIKNNHKLLYVGRVEKYKGVQFALKALPKIVKKYPDTIFMIAGDGNYKEDLVRLTSKLKLEKNVEFLGWVEHGEIEKYYEETSIVMLPSFWPEAFGKTGVEGMSKGRVVIASNIGGIPEWLENNKNGFLVEPKNSNQIAEKVLKLFDDKSLLLSMSKSARKRAEAFSIEKYAKKMEKAYLDLKK